MAILSVKYRTLYKKSRKEKKKINKVLEQVKLRYQTILDVVDENLMVSIADPFGKILYINKPFQKICGYSSKELMGKDHRVFNSGEHDREFFSNLWNTVKAGKPWTGEIKNKAKDGTFFWSNTIILPFADENGKINQFMALRIPVTQRKEIEEKQRKHIASLEKILNDISHKLRAPIATCAGLTQLLEFKEGAPQDYLDRAIDHRKVCASSLITFAQEIQNFIYKETGKFK